MMAPSDAPLVNRVAQSGLITLNLEDYFPRDPLLSFDLKDYLFQGLILREKDFREALKTHEWTQYQGAHLAVHCSADAIIPVWAYMLVSALAAPYAIGVRQCTTAEYIRSHYEQVLATFDPEPFRDQRVVIKGCSDKPVPPAAYVELTRRLQPFAQSIMYGEPCSTVPVFKRPRKLD
jgi:hypothetical protein